jgi:protein-disulfide isomerase
MKKVVLLFIVFLSVYALQAQKEQPTPTPLPTPETVVETPEAGEDTPLTFDDAVAELPQSRLEDGGFVLGALDAPITVIEFMDWACSHCQDYREIIEPVLVEYLLAGQVKYELRMLPTAGGAMTIFAGQVAECADDLTEGGFWGSSTILYDVAVEGNYNVDDIVAAVASKLDLDSDDLVECTEDAQQVGVDMEFADQLGVAGTPAVLVRYGDDAPVYIEIDDIIYDRGGVPADILIFVIEAAQDVEPTPTTGK